MSVVEQPISLNALKSNVQKIDALRDHIGKLLADGLQTQTEPFPKLDEERFALMAELRELPTDRDPRSVGSP